MFLQFLSHVNFVSHVDKSYTPLLTYLTWMNQEVIVWPSMSHQHSMVPRGNLWSRAGALRHPWFDPHERPRNQIYEDQICRKKKIKICCPKILVRYGGVAYMASAKTKSIAGQMVCEHGLMYGMQLETASSKNTSCKVLCCVSVYFRFCFVFKSVFLFLFTSCSLISFTCWSLWTCCPSVSCFPALVCLVLCNNIIIYK